MLCVCDLLFCFVYRPVDLVYSDLSFLCISFMMFSVFFRIVLFCIVLYCIVLYCSLIFQYRSLSRVNHFSRDCFVCKWSSLAIVIANALLVPALILPDVNVPQAIAQERILGSILVQVGNNFAQLEFEFGNHCFESRCLNRGCPEVQSSQDRRDPFHIPSEENAHGGQKSRNPGWQDADHGSDIASENHGDNGILQ